MLGTAEFRPGQAEAIDAVLVRDTLAVLASGTGKTLVYTIAAKLIDGGTLVVSPTIALQHDQLRALEATGERAALLNTTVRPAERKRALAEFAAGRIEFLLLAPEQLANDEVLAALRAAPVSLLVVDEAHCISEWGHDFRPDYLALGSVARALGSPRLLALTATASPRVREEIVRRLRMRDPEIVVRDADRPNIWLGVDLVGSEEQKREELVDQVLLALHGEPDHEEIDGTTRSDHPTLPTGSGGVEPGGPGIVYTATHRGAEQTAALLRDNGVDAVHYHGGLSRADRDAAQDAFMRGDVDVMVATSAFGMGVDKPDVRFVFHTEPPDTLDAYYQEIGRAGRDREPARAALFYLPSDLSLPRFFASGGGPTVPEMTGVLQAIRDDGPVSRKDLVASTGLSAARVTAIVERAGGGRGDPVPQGPPAGRRPGPGTTCRRRRWPRPRPSGASCSGSTRARPSRWSGRTRTRPTAGAGSCWSCSASRTRSGAGTATTATAASRSTRTIARSRSGRRSPTRSGAAARSRRTRRATGWWSCSTRPATRRCPSTWSRDTTCSGRLRRPCRDRRRR